MIDVMISTPCPFASNMPHRIFEIYELARLISCHLALTDDTARCPSSSMFHLSWTRRYAMEVLFPTRNSGHRQVTDHNSLRNPWHRFRRYATWMRRLDLDRGCNRWMADDIFSRLLAGSTGGLVCPALCHLACCLKPTSLRFIPHFFS